MSEEDEEDLDEDQPDYDNDIFVSWDRNAGPRSRGAYIASESGKIIEEDENQSLLYKKVKAYMKKSNFFPNVWFVSDHGNEHLVTTLD